MFRETVLNAEEAYDNHVDAARASLGTLGVRVGQVRDAELRTIDDSMTSDELPEGHAYIDFRPLTKRQTNTAAERLLRQATANGWAFKPS